MIVRAFVRFQPRSRQRGPSETGRRRVEIDEKAIELAAFLYGISPLDAVAFVAAATALLVAAVLSSLIPARRAARTDPVSSMRTI
jgi:ABC-type lipoprotein release transport system permease subunit